MIYTYGAPINTMAAYQRNDYAADILSSYLNNKKSHRHQS